MKKFICIILTLIIGCSFTLSLQSSVFAKSYKSYTPKIYSHRISNQRYIVPRKSIPVPKTSPVKGHYKPSSGKWIAPFFRAPKDSLKPWHNPSYQKPLK